MSKTFDLSTLNLSAGTHTITVKARASGYTDSVESNAVSYVVAGADTVQVSGTWRFNDIPNIASQHINESCKFTTESGDSVTGIEISDSKTSIYRVYFNAGGKSGYDINNGWDRGCQVITFDGTQYVSQEFYEWLVANAKRPISGTWKWVDPKDFADYGYGVTAEFTSNGNAFDGISGWGQYILYNQTKIYSRGDGWVNENYQYITFSGTQYLYDFEYQNFTRVAVFAFTIDGTTYYAKEGMTWGEWVASEYNTGGFSYDGESVVVSKADGRYFVDDAFASGLIIVNKAYTTSKGGVSPT